MAKTDYKCSRCQNSPPLNEIIVIRGGMYAFFDDKLGGFLGGANLNEHYYCAYCILAEIVQTVAENKRRSTPF